MALQTHLAEPEVVAELLPLLRGLSSQVSIEAVTLMTPTTAEVSVTALGVENTQVEMVQTNGVWQLSTAGLCGLLSPGTLDSFCEGDPPRPVEEPCAVFSNHVLCVFGGFSDDFENLR